MIIFGNKKLEELKEEDIRNLLTRREEERVILEYKKELDRNTIEIAKDVTGIAHAEGGLLIYGIEEDGDGKPTAINWLEASGNLPEKLDEVLSSTVTPNVPFIVQAIKKEDEPSKQIYIVFIPKSMKLHMVIKNHDNRYYKRVNRTVQRMEHSEIQERIRALLENERKHEGFIEMLEKNFVEHLRADLENNFHLAFVVEPEDLHVKVSQDDLLNILNNMGHPYPVTGVVRRSYKRSVFINNYDIGSPEFYKEILIIHPSATVEFRLTGRYVETFYSQVFAKRLAALLWWCLELFKKMNYYGCIKLTANLKKIRVFQCSRTMGNAGGLHQFRGDNILESVDFPSTLILTEDIIKQKIIELTKHIGGYATVTGDGYYIEVQQALAQQPLDRFIHQMF